MRYRYAIPAFAVAFFLQGTLLNLIAVFDMTPNLLLCLVTAISFLYDGSYSGVVLGVAFGLLTDFCYGQYAGPAALCCLLVGAGVLLFREILNRENFVTILLVTAGSTVLYNSLYWLLYYLMGSTYTFMYMLRHLPMMILYNMLVVGILYFILIGHVTRYRRDRYYR